eukprot:TRINITY_DN8672_c1_g2_i1.p1 TRINITY_DN8672_c1_g2~~TRINITY_DN8672_c1_g2_i1.p1  ORF type:complete len:249 (+),score=-12.15 TRINITY_DN8672_c1_g2_i1:456-1202(+)
MKTKKRTQKYSLVSIFFQIFTQNINNFLLQTQIILQNKILYLKGLFLQKKFTYNKLFFVAPPTSLQEDPTIQMLKNVLQNYQIDVNSRNSRKKNHVSIKYTSAKYKIVRKILDNFCEKWQITFYRIILYENVMLKNVFRISHRVFRISHQNTITANNTISIVSVVDVSMIIGQEKLNNQTYYNQKKLSQVYVELTKIQIVLPKKIPSIQTEDNETWLQYFKNCSYVDSKTQFKNYHFYLIYSTFLKID